MPRATKPCIVCGSQCNGAMCRKCRSASIAVSDEHKATYQTQWQRARKYGMAPNEFEFYWTAQMGKCFICNEQMKMPRLGRGQLLDAVAVDHDHKTNKVRGLLCGACNRGLGMFKDDVERLKSAIKYLELGVKNETVG